MVLPPHGGSEKGVFIWAEGQQESGGNYRAVNPGSGALGRWQVMPANLPGWAAHCRMPAASPAYFLSHPAYQNRMIDCVLGGYYARYGPYGAAAMWYSGQPDWHATYGNPPVYQYVADVISIMRSGHAKPIPGIGGLGPAAPRPSARKEDYSDRVIHTARKHLHTGRAFNEGAIALRRLRG